MNHRLFTPGSAATLFLCVTSGFAWLVYPPRLQIALDGLMGGQSGVVVASTSWLGWLSLAAGVVTLAMLQKRGYHIRTADQRRREGKCPACGYDLRATPTRCPECGSK